MDLREALPRLQAEALETGVSIYARASEDRIRWDLGSECSCAKVLRASEKFHAD